MSFNRENVVWQGRDGRWSAGHYEFYSVNQDDEDFDPEWDVEYDYDHFHWAVTGMPTMDAAMDRYPGPNPGHHSVLEWNERNAEEIAKLDKMAADCLSPVNRPHPR